MRLFAGLVFLLATPAMAEDPAAASRAAAAQLEAAATTLEAAHSARDRVRALTTTVQAYEAGLEAMRDGLRRAATREAQLSRQLAAREDEIAALLGSLQTISAAPPPVQLVHPSGPVGAARSGMILAEVTPSLASKAAILRQDLEEVRDLRLLQENAAQTLADGLAGVQAARADLSQAIADRTDLPKRFTEDPIKTAILIASTETLDGFASGLSELADGDIAAATENIEDQKGDLPWPVAGVVLRTSGEADAAGVARPGVLIATRPRAIVTAPVSATIRYRGPLLDLGNVLILEPEPDLLIILSGLAEVYGDQGEVVPTGTAVGLMGGNDPTPGAILSLSSDGTGTVRSETLYIEVRQENEPVDPENWFHADKDG